MLSSPLGSHRDPSKFPFEVKIVFGPGVKEQHMPDWPLNPNAEFKEEDIRGGEIIEISQSHFNIDLEWTKDHDYFGDGSFYLLSGVTRKEYEHMSKVSSSLNRGVNKSP